LLREPGTRAAGAGAGDGRRAAAADPVTVGLGTLVAAGLIALAFATTGGVLGPLGANTWSQIALVLVAVGAGIAVLMAGGAGRAWGVGALVAFAALAALTYASIAWSVTPAASWLEGNRTLSYLAAFATALAVARLAPRRWPALVGGVAVYAVVVSAYALLAKVFPETFAASESLGRLDAPFGYFNASGLAAALGLPAWLWLGAARGRLAARVPWRRTATALSVLAIGVLVCALILSYGRGALVAAVIGLAVWFALVPARLRGTAVLAVGALGGIGLSLWATAQPDLVHDYIPLAARSSAGHRFGVALLVGLAVLLLAGVATAFIGARVRVGETQRRRIGVALLAALALVPVGGVAALAASSRGFGGEVSHLWSTVTSAQGGAADTPGRLTQLGSSRPRYWRDGLRVGEHAPLGGVGANGFAVAHKRYTSDVVEQAHSYVVQTFADLGAVGLAVSALLLVGWGVAVRRTLAARPAAGAAGGTGAAGAARGAGAARAGADALPAGPAAAGADALAAGPAATERDGLLTLLAVTVIFGVHSAVDWTWFIPGCAVPALLCAGWLAGRGPLAQAVGRRPHARTPLTDPVRAGTALALLTAALVAAWFVWQPLHAANAESAAIDALASGNGAAALHDAQAAVSANPLDIDARTVLADVYLAAGDVRSARAELLRATRTAPEDPATWLQLAAFDQAHGRGSDAARERARAHALEPYGLPRRGGGG